jgi:hypothetical protein
MVSYVLDSIYSILADIVGTRQDPLELERHIL